MSLELDTDVEIVRENLNAVQAIYFSYMLEEMQLYQVLDRIVELFMQGLLPIGEPAAVERVKRIALSGKRLTEEERRSFYSIALGAPGGDNDAAVSNREFLSLWMRFLVAVAAYAQQHGAAGALAPATAANADVRDAARALAANCSAHGGGIVLIAAQRLAADARDAIDLLGSWDVRSAYGADDAWQVVERINVSDLGGGRDVTHYRTEATSGSTVLKWLADHMDLLAANPVPSGPQDDAALVDAVNCKLAASSGQVEAAGADPAAPARPDLRRATDDLLDALGVPAAERARPDPVHLRKSVAMFTGGPRTGKTLAAYLLAHAVGKDVTRVDLAQVSSKYIGQTEEQLDMVFRHANESGAVLLLDEADALFGKRSEIKDSHDRYANLDVAYVLQRLEDHDGLAILTRNSDVNTDDDASSDAWRRLRMKVVRFPRRPN